MNHPNYCDICGENVNICQDRACQNRIESEPKPKPKPLMHSVIMLAGLMLAGPSAHGSGGRSDPPPRPPSPRPTPKRGPARACHPSDAEMRRNRSTGGPVTEQTKRKLEAKAQRRKSAKNRRGRR